MRAENDILYENGDYWVSAEEFGSGRLRPKSSGYIVWRNGITHATAAYTIGIAGEAGLARAIAEADKLAAADLRP
jgi:hypothetical protein